MTDAGAVLLIFVIVAVALSAVKPQEELAQRTLPSWGAIGQALRAKLEGAREWVQGGALIGNRR